MKQIQNPNFQRHKNAAETLTKTNSSTIAHPLVFGYDSLSQLTDATIGNISGGNWTGMYSYNKNGDMSSRTINSGTATNFTYSGNMMASASNGETFSLAYDENGQLTDGYDSAEFTYNWDNKLRTGARGSQSIGLKYDPMGNRLYKNSSEAGARKYIVDIVGDLPVILLELDVSDFSVKKAYIYGNSQIIAQYDGNPFSANKYFYLHDRLGSVRQIIDGEADVVSLYTYNPFGETIEEYGSFDNSFKFTGQWYDDEIGWYYLRARMYDPHLSRFTGRDPILGDFQEPLTLHKYLYCGNDPLNRIDLDGRRAFTIGGSVTAMLKNHDMTFGLGIIGRNMFLSFLVESMQLDMGGTVGFTFAAVKDDDFSLISNKGWSFGILGYGSAGMGYTTSSSGAITVDFGYSPQAQHVKDLSGWFAEVGGSLSTPPIPWLGGINTFGLTVSRGMDISGGHFNDIYLYTLSLGWGKGVDSTPWGTEGHVFAGYSQLFKWWGYAPNEK